MYSRFTPGPNGVYQRKQIPTAKPVSPPPPAASPPKQEPLSLKQRIRELLPKGLELGDVLVILIALLLLIDGEEDMQTILITAAAFLFL